MEQNGCSKIIRLKLETITLSSAETGHRVAFFKPGQRVIVSNILIKNIRGCPRQYIKCTIRVSIQKSRLSAIKQHKLMEHFVAGTTARCTADLVGVNRKTAAYYYHRLREIIAYKLSLETD